jgi:hypothetical protein
VTPRTLLFRKNVGDNAMIAGAVEQADAADEPHGGWKDSKVAYLHLKSGSQLIRGVGPTLGP